jgi:RNA polymerase sigma-70 factor (ECF subfamily)
LGTPIARAASNAANEPYGKNMTSPSASPLPSAATLTEPELALRIAAGDTGALEALMRRYNRTLFRTARAILRDDAEAEEALQDAYLKVFRSIAQFRGDSKLSTWLVRIVANEALMRRRKRARKAEVVVLHSDGGGSELKAEQVMDVNEGPEGSAVRAQTRRLLEAKIDALPDAFRTVFMLRALEEFSVEETAQALDIPEATVRTRFFRARGLLREALSREIDHAFDDAFGFDGARCDRVVANVLSQLQKE